MKIAIIGHDENAFLCAEEFCELGAAVTLFTHFNEKKDLDQRLTQLNSEILIKKNIVTQIHKRFVLKNETIPLKTRFHDLFRVCYEVDPNDSIYQDKITEEIKQNLKNKLEFFEDFDVVVNSLKSTNTPKPVGIDYWAIGEKNLRNSNGLNYGHSDLPANVNEINEIAILGTSQEVVELLIKLENWLMQDREKRIFLISPEASPIDKLKKEFLTNTRLIPFFQNIDDNFQKQIQEFQNNLNSWNSLEDYEKAKYPRPMEPIPQLVVFSGHQATALDRLIDKNRFFLTIEKPDFRDCLEHKENGVIDLKTIGVDLVYALHGFNDHPELDKNLSEDEIGYFKMKSQDQISEMKSDLLKRFSRI
jgi:hypothetical protein